MSRKTSAQPLRCVAIFDAGSAQTVIAHDEIACGGDICLRGTGPLVHERIAPKIEVERVGAAIERVSDMARGQLDDLGVEVGVGAQPPEPDSLRSLARRGLGFGGASRAVRKAAHFWASSRNICRSASTLSARAS